MSGITLHPRTMKVSRAQAQATLWLIGWQEENDLTEGEVLGWLAQQLAQMAKYAVRNERRVEKGDEAPMTEPPETPVTVVDAVMAIFEVVRNEEDWAFLVDRLAVEYDRDGEELPDSDDQEEFDADRRFADVLRGSIDRAAPPEDWSIDRASPPEDWPSPLMIASGESTPERAAKKLGWPLRVCEAIHVQFLASALDDYSVRFLKALAAGQEKLEKDTSPSMDPGHMVRVRGALFDMVRAFVADQEGGDE